MIEPFLPMLAVKAEPFDAPDYLFEVKWDGIRTLASRTADGWRLWGRELADYRDRYPELEVLAGLPVHCVLDGEVVVLARGRPELNLLLRRHASTSPRAARALRCHSPVTYLVFDALYDQGRCLFGAPLEERRALAQERVLRLNDPRVVFSEAVQGAGKAYFARVIAQGQEGMMAKHRASRYHPGRRCAAWKKVKPFHHLPAVIVGYVPGREGVRGLFVAALAEGRLQYVACLRGGLREPARQHLAGLLAKQVRARPAVPCPKGGVWVEPVVYCQVRYLEWTRAGRLRGASFCSLLHASELQQPLSP